MKRIGMLEAMPSDLFNLVANKIFDFTTLDDHFWDGENEPDVDALDTLIRLCDKTSYTMRQRCKMELHVLNDYLRALLNLLGFFSQEQEEKFGSFLGNPNMSQLAIVASLARILDDYEHQGGVSDCNKLFKFPSYEELVEEMERVKMIRLGKTPTVTTEEMKTNYESAAPDLFAFEHQYYLIVGRDPEQEVIFVGNEGDKEQSTDFLQIQDGDYSKTESYLRTHLLIFFYSLCEMNPSKELEQKLLDIMLYSCVEQVYLDFEESVFIASKVRRDFEWLVLPNIAAKLIRAGADPNAPMTKDNIKSVGDNFKCRSLYPDLLDIPYKSYRDAIEARLLEAQPVLR